MRHTRNNKHLLSKLVVQYEKDLLMEAIRLFNGQASRVAEHFKMGRNTLYRRLEYHGINLTKLREEIRREVRVVNGGLLIPVGEKRRQFIARVPKIGKSKGSL